MNIIDVLLILIVLLAVGNGIARGFFVSMAGLIAWLASLLTTFCLYPYLASFLKAHLMHNTWTIPLAFLATLILAGSVLSVLSSWLLTAIPYRAHASRINKLLGFIPGIAVGVVYAAVVSGLLLLPLSPAISAETRESPLARRLTTNLERVEQQLIPIAGNTVNRSMNKMTIEPGSSDRVELPFKVTHANPRPDLENEMLHLINREREAADLPPLEKDEDLTPIARQHSDDMFSRGYFSHISPEGETPSDRIRQAGVPFLTAGENLALAQTLFLAHEGLMNSPRASSQYPASRIWQGGHRHTGRRRARAHGHTEFPQLRRFKHFPKNNCYTTKTTWCPLTGRKFLSTT